LEPPSELDSPQNSVDLETPRGSEMIVTPRGTEILPLPAEKKQCNKNLI